MLSFEEVQEILSAAADELPQGIYDGLNGGIILSPDTKRHPGESSLFVQGEYVTDPAGLGRYIVIYYGSLQRTLGHLSSETLKKKLREILYHELTHHLEGLAGDRALEIEDAKGIAEYKSRRRAARRDY